MADDDLEDLAAFRKRMLGMPQRQAELIATCRANGRTWPQIAEVLGMTVHGAIKAANPSTTPAGRPKKAQPEA